MNWNYEDLLTRYIYEARSDCGLKDEFGNDYIFEVCTEQIFAKKKVEPNKIYVVIKYLTTTNTLNITTRPIQILILCEQNQLQASQIIFSKLVATHNFEAFIVGDMYIKQDYREPVVLSNFNAVSYGYRSVMYLNATLYVMENIVDISTTDANGNYVGNAIKIGDEVVRLVSSSLAYAMTPNTQPIPPDKLATSVKSVATFSLSFVISLTDEYSFVQTVSSIMAGITTGDTTFSVSFNLGTTAFSVDMKLISAQITTAINQAPSLQIGLTK